MIFSDEDNLAWRDSEVIREFEKIANSDLVSIKDPEEDNWEEEDFEEALNEFEKPNSQILKNLELHEAYNNAVIRSLQKLSNYFAIKSNIKVSYKIEQSINELKDHFGRKL